MALDPELRELLGTMSGALGDLQSGVRQFDVVSSRLGGDDWDRLLPKEYSWTLFFEIGYREHSILTFASLGLLRQFERFDWDAPSKTKRFLERGLEVSSNESFYENWAGGDGGLFVRADVVALVLAMLRQMQSIATHGASLSELIELAGKGSDEALFKAVSIDKTVVACSTAAGRITRASVENDTKFFRLLGAAIARMPKKHWRSYDDLRLLLHLCYEMGALDDLSQTDADKIFIQELRLYSDRGKDPARSLFRFIQRWKAEKLSAT